MVSVAAIAAYRKIKMTSARTVPGVVSGDREPPMGTKLKPGKFDCYANAEPDEPMFVLLARDQMAGFLTAIWSKVRVGDFEAATTVFETMLGEVLPRYEIEPDMDKSAEAIECAMAMFAWRKKNRPSP